MALLRSGAICGALMSLVSVARADVHVVGEVPAAIALSDVHRGVFRPGAMPAGGVYVGREHLRFGLRMRAGVLRDGPAPGDNFEDPGLGGLVTMTAAVRAVAGGAWIELAGGGGVTGTDPVPTFEVGVGWGIQAGSYVVGPSARYVHVVGRDQMHTLGSAGLLIAGVDVAWGRAPTRPRPRPAPIEAPRSIPPEPPVYEIVSGGVPLDGDRVADQDASCADDLDGCPVIQHVRIENDRIILDERVLFDTDRARVRSLGRAVVREIGALWRAHPEWLRITIEGHADVRGSDAYNLALSQRRAERVRAVLVKLGFDASRIDAVGYGRSRPRDAAATPNAHTRNRRVEFVIERGQP